MHTEQPQASLHSALVRIPGDLSNASVLLPADDYLFVLSLLPLQVSGLRYSHFAFCQRLRLLLDGKGWCLCPTVRQKFSTGQE